VSTTRILSRVRVTVTLRLAVYRQSVRLGDKPSRPTTRIFILQLNTCGYSPYVTSSLMRGWVCRLQLLLGLASAVILRSESRGTHDHILLSQIRDFPFRRLLLLGGVRPRLHTRYIHTHAHTHLGTNPPTFLSLQIEGLHRHGPYSKHCVIQLLYCCVHIRCLDDVFIEPLRSDDRLFWLLMNFRRCNVGITDGRDL
jgi:hypothetical protein